MNETCDLVGGEIRSWTPLDGRRFPLPGLPSSTLDVGLGALRRGNAID